MGSRLYVAALRLDRNRGFVPAASGLIAVIDTTTDTLVDVDPRTPEIDAIKLAGENPFGLVYDPSSDKIWVWETGRFSVPDDGGIEAIDPTTNRAEGFIASEADLGGTVTVVAPYTATRAFAVVADEDFRNRLVAFSPATGKIIETLRTSAPSYFPDVAVNDRGEVWLADRTLRAPGIRIFDAESGRAVAGPIDVGLPPFAILFLHKGSGSCWLWHPEDLVHLRHDANLDTETRHPSVETLERARSDTQPAVFGVRDRLQKHGYALAHRRDQAHGHLDLSRVRPFVDQDLDVHLALGSSFAGRPRVRPIARVRPNCWAA